MVEFYPVGLVAIAPPPVLYVFMHKLLKVVFFFLVLQLEVEVSVFQYFIVWAPHAQVGTPCAQRGNSKFTVYTENCIQYTV